MATLWTISIDDSGDAHKKVFIIAGCLVGNKEEWSAFHKAWRSELSNPPGNIEYFHQKECAGRSGEFRQFYDRAKWPPPSGKEAAQQKREALLVAIAKSPLSCYAMALRVADYEYVRNSSQKAKKYLHTDPWAYLIQELAFDTASSIVGFDPAANIAFMAGPHEKSAQYEEFYEGFKQKNPVIADHMLSMTHGDFRKLYSLQAADLIASESKKCWESAERGDLEDDVFKNHPILARFIQFKTIHKERLEGVVAVQGSSATTAS
jgi:hypothetical protein